MTPIDKLHEYIEDPGTSAALRAVVHDGLSQPDNSFPRTMAAMCQTKTSWNSDGWSGVSVQRAQILSMAERYANNFVVLGGDVHDSWSYIMKHNGRTNVLFDFVCITHSILQMNLLRLTSFAPELQVLLHGPVLSTLLLNLWSPCLAASMLLSILLNKVSLIASTRNRPSWSTAVLLVVDSLLLRPPKRSTPPNICSSTQKTLSKTSRLLAKTTVVA